jgi:hypothetical protein
MRPLSSSPADWRRTLCLAFALISALLVGTAGAQLPGLFPDPGELRDSQLDGGLENALNRARGAVSEARDAAVSAKAELEAAIAAVEEANESGRANDKTVVPSSTSRARPASDAVADANAEELATLRRLIAELKAERMELLAHLTHRHPLIVDADLRLEEYQRQLVVLTARTAAEQGAEHDQTLRFAADDESVSVRETPSTHSNALEPEADQRLLEGSQRLRQAMAKWDAAQEMLEAAVDAESATAERIAALAAEKSRSQAAAAMPPQVETSALEMEIVAAADSEAPPDPDAAMHAHRAAPADSEGTRGSQPLVLAALIVALVIAAIASVKLARATDESVFAGADDAAAVLSLPVVGVIPAPTAAMAHGNVFQRYRTLTFLAQVLVAVAVFALVAFFIEKPGFVWQLLTDPSSAWR